jgi:hypothetical protein
MKLRSFIILIVLVLSMILIFYANKLLQRRIQPRRTFLRFLIYIISAFAVIFIYTFFVVWIIAYLFPLSN